MIGPDSFFDLVAAAARRLEGTEVLLASFAGETSDFVRLNRARVRQAMTVRQGYVTLSFIDGGRRDVVTLSLSGDRDADGESLVAAVARMRGALPVLPEDPYLLYSTEPSSSHAVRRGSLPAPDDALAAILEASRGVDLVGLYASGPVARGFASSLGHRHWHEADRYQLDFSLYLSTDKAVSESFAASDWDGATVTRRISEAREKLSVLSRPARTLSPGTYRAFLSPAALAEVVGLLSWDGVSEKAQRTKTSSLQNLVDGKARLSPLFSLSENTEGGEVPAFDDLGFTRPGVVPLVKDGLHVGAMVSPRTAREYGIPSNGAGAGEGMVAADVAPGTLAAQDVLSTLDCGVCVGNFHYLNFSDRQNGRVTGMTRFATFWVERGEIQAPVNVMRFDDTLYRMFGDNLVALTKEREFIPTTSTYGQRGVETMRLPGGLLSELSFTL
jgi:predicted Zn-dependent protease